MGCSTLGYYGQSVAGHMELLAERRPIQDWLDDPATSDELRARLMFVRAVREFASRELALPDNGSYRSYADLQRPYVVWGLTAAPELSLEPVRWCYPFVGRLSYRGYFAEADALAHAERLAAQDYDVHVQGVPAYSTLGWFDDPVLNTMLHWSDANLAGLIFHELAHQVVYIADDTAFNESFAVAVERAGVQRWMAQRRSAADYAEYLAQYERREAFIGLILATRARLERLYASPRPADEKRAAKRREFAQLQAAYTALRQSWGGHDDYGAWLAGGMNNAALNSVATYEAYVPAFSRLLVRQQGDFAAFFKAVAELGRLPPEQRRARLEALAPGQAPKDFYGLGRDSADSGL